MITRLFQIIGLLFTISALLLFWSDTRQSDEPAKLLGQLWYDLSPQSLQLTEAVIDRYIDPCGLMPFLGCDTFLWHPIIATLLNWPAGLVLGLFGIMLLIITASSRKNSRKSARSLKKEGR